MLNLGIFSREELELLSAELLTRSTNYENMIVTYKVSAGKTVDPYVAELYLGTVPALEKRVATINTLRTLIINEMFNMERKKKKWFVRENSYSKH